MNLDDSIPLWFNFGYWRNCTTFVEAAKATATLVADKGKFASNDIVLGTNSYFTRFTKDVGFGCGDAAIYWHNNFGVDVMGLNIAPHQVRIAQNRVEKLGLTDHIFLKLGSANDIQLHFPNKQFTKICSIDSAYHFFPSRNYFFHQGIYNLAFSVC